MSGSPDIIYITNYPKYIPEDLYNHRAVKGHDWSGVEAVREHRVYKYPLGMYSIQDSFLKNRFF